MEDIVPNIADETRMDFEDIDDETSNISCRFPRRHPKKMIRLCMKDERTASIRKISVILQKSERERTLEESQMLKQCSDAVEEIQLRWKKRDEAKRRLEEFEDSMEEIQEKCQVLAQAIAQAQHLVVYTGAGISTAAKIPDYRGPNGIWTRLQQGKEIENHDLSLAEPTYTHMALYQLYRRKILKYVVSQNCDGLHLRSGLPRSALSELHGNMNVEVCKSCKPHKEYWRVFDVTENTARYAHKTMRKCYACNSPLVDTIVHFGEKGSLQWPLNWSGASKNALKATTILCLGSSLKVLKRYPWLWQMDKPVRKRPNLYIVNLQWTPKDDCANVKIHGKCDAVMKFVMNFLGIDVTGYDRNNDPIFHHATVLCEEEQHTTTQPALKYTCDSNLHSFKIESCDTEHDTHNNSCNYRNIISNLEPFMNKCSFNNDNILHNSGNHFLNSLSFSPNYAFLAYYAPLLAYPYQTSFLYSGLHSIINPLTMWPNNLNSLNSKPQIVCTFCNEQFQSTFCLFYRKMDSTFIKSEGCVKIICVCCDSPTDEDDEKRDDMDDTDKDQDMDKDQLKMIKIQAGWFGKGYRKVKRNKKR